MLTVEDNERLCRVGPGTAMGRVLEQFWFPVLVSAELPVGGGAPKRVELLGRRFVAVRDRQGRLSLLDEYCPHRGASLVLGRVEDCGVRCVYHGWQIAPDGQVLETPTEPDDSRLRERVRQPAYRLHESAGLIWAHVGEPATVPAAPVHEWDTRPAEWVLVVKHVQECNWLQTLENSLDTSHVEILHQDYLDSAESSDREDVIRRSSNDAQPRIRVSDTEYGFLTGALRKAFADPENLDAVRALAVVMPSTVIARVSEEVAVAQVMTPIDDVRCGVYTVYWGHEGPINRDALLRMGGQAPGVDIDQQDFRPVRTASNQWLQDRRAMNDGTSFSGIRGLFNEDLAITEAMQPIVPRHLEHLGASDKSIVHLRQRLLESLDRVEAGQRPVGWNPEGGVAHLRGRAAVIAKGDDWLEAVRPVGHDAAQ